MPPSLISCPLCGSSKVTARKTHRAVDTTAKAASEGAAASAGGENAGIDTRNPFTATPDHAVGPIIGRPIADVTVKYHVCAECGISFSQSGRSADHPTHVDVVNDT